jgi:hypothetical protein
MRLAGAIVLLAIIAFVVLRFALMGLRFFRDDDAEPGGSYGRQLFRRPRERH